MKDKIFKIGNMKCVIKPNGDEYTYVNGRLIDVFTQACKDFAKIIGNPKDKKIPTPDIGVF